MSTSPVFSEKSAYEEWIEAQGIPIYRGHAVEDLNAIELAPWKRVGGKGAHIYLKGGGGTSDAYLSQLAPNERTFTERHLYEEWLFVLGGEGGTAFFGPKGEEKKILWKAGALISVPLNVPHYHFNRGNDQLRYLGVTNAPMVFDLFHNEDLVFKVDLWFRDRYNFEDDYFDKGGLVEAQSVISGRPRTYPLWVSNFVPDVNAVGLRGADRAREVDIGHIQFDMCDNTMTSHISKWPPGTYMPSHLHGPGAHIIILEGEGYTLLWRGNPWYSRGFDKAKVNWRPGSLLSVPGAWFHQHFNVSPGPTRFLAIRWGSFRHRLNLLMGEGGHGEYATVSIREGGNQVDYQDEDPCIRQMYDDELARRGLQSRMAV